MYKMLNGGMSNAKIIFFELDVWNDDLEPPLSEKKWAGHPGHDVRIARSLDSNKYLKSDRSSWICKYPSWFCI